MKHDAGAAKWFLLYRRALRRNLEQGRRLNLAPAFALGRKAVALGLATQALARFHEQALSSLIPPGCASGTCKRLTAQARAFFAETIVPIEQTHPAARDAAVRIAQLSRKLTRRTTESTASLRRLEHTVVGRMKAETTARKSGRHHARLLAESHRLQKQLKRLTRGILLAQEVERQKISRRLRDEVAQLLIAIDIRLMTLKKADASTTAGLRKEIAKTEQLVTKSTAAVHGFAHEYKYGIRHKT